MRGGPRPFPQGSSCPVVLRIPLPSFFFRLRGFHPLRPAFPAPFRFFSGWSFAAPYPGALPRPGLGSSRFARRYSGNHFCFLLLRLLRCFSSPGSLLTAMDSQTGTQAPPAWVPPFRHLRIKGYLPLPAAFRSLSRLSSAPSAKASALCPFQLSHPRLPSVGGGRFSSCLPGRFFSFFFLLGWISFGSLFLFGIRFSRYVPPASRLWRRRDSNS